MGVWLNYLLLWYVFDTIMDIINRFMGKANGI